MWVMNGLYGTLAGATKLLEKEEDAIKFIKESLEVAPTYKITQIDKKDLSEDWEDNLRKMLKGDKNFQVDLEGDKGETPVALMFAKLKKKTEGNRCPSCQNEIVKYGFCSECGVDLVKGHSKSCQYNVNHNPVACNGEE